MNAFTKSLLATTCLFAVSCDSGSDSKKSDEAPAANTPAPVVPTPTPTPTNNPEPTPGPVEPAKGFRFVDAGEVELPVYVRGGMNGWLGEGVSAELVTASRLNLDPATGCYVGTLNVEAGETPFRLATYLPDAAGKGWEYLKVGLGAANTSTAVTLGEATKVDVYYYPAGDANGKDLGGGGNFIVNFPKKGDYLFAFCTEAENYQQSFLTVSAK